MVRPVAVYLRTRGLVRLKRDLNICRLSIVGGGGDRVRDKPRRSGRGRIAQTA